MEFTEVVDDPLNPGKYIAAEELRRREEGLATDAGEKKKKKKKKKGHISTASIMENADKDEPITDSDEEDQADSLNSLLTFAKGKVAQEKRKEALEVGVFEAATKAEEQTISATQQLKIDARLKKKEDQIRKERNRKKALVTQGIEAIVSTEELLLEEISNSNSNGDDFFLLNSDSASVEKATEALNRMKNDERVAKFKEHFAKGQSCARAKDFTKALMHLKIAFKFLVNTTTSKYAAMCIGTAASIEFALGELQKAKNHSRQALSILQNLHIRDEKLEKLFTITLNKALDDLGEGRISLALNSALEGPAQGNQNGNGGKGGTGDKAKTKKNRKGKKGGKQKSSGNGAIATQPQTTSDLLKSLGL